MITETIPKILEKLSKDDIIYNPFINPKDPKEISRFANIQIYEALDQKRYKHKLLFKVPSKTNFKTIILLWLLRSSDTSMLGPLG